MAVYDCTMFFNENDLFEIKLNQHWEFVDKFIVIEAGETHTGLTKPLNFDHKRFEKYSSKIEYRTFANFDEELKKFPQYISSTISEDATRDHFQFNYTFKVLLELGAQDHDLVYFSCLDEIISHDAFNRASEIFKEKDKFHIPFHCVTKQSLGQYGLLRPIVNFELIYYAFKFNALRIPFGRSYQAGSITEVGNFKKILPADIRQHCLTTHPFIERGGWHFSFADNTDGDMVHKKMKSWAHSREILHNGVRRYDLTKEEALKFLFNDFNMDFPNCVIPISEDTHPKYLVENQDKFKNFIWPK